MKTLLKLTHLNKREKLYNKLEKLLFLFALDIKTFFAHS